MHKNLPIPPGILPDIIKIFREKIAAGVYKPSDAFYRSHWFCIKKKSSALHLVYNLQPLNAVTIRNSRVPPITNQVIEGVMDCLPSYLISSFLSHTRLRAASLLAYLTYL